MLLSLYFFYSSTHTLFQCFSVNYNLVFSISNFFNFLWEVMKKWRYEKKKREGDRLEFFERQTKFINLIRSFFSLFCIFLHLLFPENTAMTRWNCFRPGILITKFNDCKNSLFFRHWISPFLLLLFFVLYIYIYYYHSIIIGAFH